MPVDPDAKRFQAFLKSLGRGLALELGHDYAAHIKTDGTETVNQADHIQIIGDAEIAPQFIFFYVSRVDGNDNFYPLL